MLGIKVMADQCKCIIMFTEIKILSAKKVENERYVHTS